MSIVITPESKTAWEKAISKARLIKPRVRILGFGQFQVEGSKGTWYNVTFTRNEHKEFIVSCDCKGHNGSAQAKPCYHCPAVANIFKLQTIQAAEARKASACKDCGKETTQLDSTGRCSACIAVELFG